MTPTPVDKRRFTLLAGEGHRTSKRVILSYIFDWICIILFAGAGAILYSIKGSEHVFSLDDPLISYPLRSDTVSVITVGITCCAVPAIIIAAFSLLPFPQLSLPWPLRLWTLHAALLGLALSLAGAFFTTSALKGIVGKPRPDLLARCAPDLSKITQQTISGLGLHRSTAPVLVSAAICTNPDPKVIRDGFAAFPSGHCTFAWAGLLYFSLWLAAKFGLFFRGAGTGAGAGAPPLYLLVLAATPVGGALYISASRYMDYMHAGWDILGGSMVGITFSVLGFFWYHPATPAALARGKDHDGTLLLAYGARRRSTAFFWNGIVSASGLESSMQTQSGFGGEEYVDIELGAVARQGQKQGHGTGMSGGSGGGGSSSGRTLQVQNM